jgi:co-chaperonin GroES (HSP10)
MSVVIPHKFIEAVSAAKDPKKAILDFVGDLSDFEVIGDRVLVGIYMRPEKTQGGIIRPDMNKVEDVWQGKVGLVLKCGPDAFIDPDTGQHYEQALKPGDWGVFFVSDGKPLEVRKAPCRLVKDINFVARVADPSTVL